MPDVAGAHVVEGRRTAMGHENEAPHKVEAIKKYLTHSFLGHEVRHFYETGRSLQSFRIEGAGYGLLSLGEEYFFDLPDDEEGIFRRLLEARVPFDIGMSNENQRIVLTWDEQRPGFPLARIEPLDRSRTGKKPSPMKNPRRVSSHRSPTSKRPIR
jgi:hypothetical protein